MKLVDFLKMIGIIPKWTGILPFALSIGGTVIICMIGFGLIYLICRAINKQIYDIKNLLDNEYNTWEKNFLAKLLWKYPLWGFVQQLIIIIVYVFLRKIFIDWVAISIASLIFASLHYPNLFLFLATFGIEQLILNFFNFHGNLYINGFIHGFLGTTLLYFSPPILFTKFSTWKNYWELYK